MQEMIPFLEENQKEVSGCECGKPIKIVFRTTGGYTMSDGIALHSYEFYKEDEDVTCAINLMSIHDIEYNISYPLQEIYIVEEDYDSEKNAFLIGELINTEYGFQEFADELLCMFLAEYNRSAGINYAYLVPKENKLYFRPYGMNSDSYEAFTGVIHIYNVSGFITLEK